jgi:hypothetical protein
MGTAINFITNILAWIVKNSALIIGVLEAIAKAVSGVISLAPIKSQDKALEVVDNVFSAIKKGLYGLSDFLGGLGK